MLPTLRLRNRVLALLQDDGAELTSLAAAPAGGLSEIESSNREAVYEHSYDRARQLSLLGNGTGGDITIATFSGVLSRALTAWSDGASFFRWIEYPINTTGEPRHRIPGKDFISYPPDDTEPTAIRWITGDAPSGTNNIRIGYNDLHVYLHPPDGLVVATVGTTGATTYTYRVAAVDATGETLACPSVSITTGNAALSGANYNTVTWIPIYGAVSYYVYRTAGGASQGRIGTVTHSTATLSDTGLVATASTAVATRDGSVTSIEDRYLEAAAHLCVARNFDAVANKKAGNVDEAFNGDTTDFAGMMERYQARATAHRDEYRRLMRPRPEDNKGYITDKVVIPPPSHDGRYLIRAYNSRPRVR